MSACGSGTNRSGRLACGTFVLTRYLTSLGEAAREDYVSPYAICGADVRGLDMNKTTSGWLLACALGIAAIGLFPADAQTTLGGAKPQQNKIGGVAKSPPAVGGATTHTYTPPPKPGPVIGMSKPGSTGAAMPGATGALTQSGQTASNPRPNPPLKPPGKGSSVVTASSNLKCSSGACTSKGVKP